METAIRRCQDMSRGPFVKKSRNERLLKGNKLRTIKKIRRKSTNNKVFLSNNKGSEDAIEKYCNIQKPSPANYYDINVESYDEEVIPMDRNLYDSNNMHICTDTGEEFMLENNLSLQYLSTSIPHEYENFDTWNSYNEAYQMIDSGNILPDDSFLLEQTTQHYGHDSILCVHGSAASTTLTRKCAFDHNSLKDNDESKYLNTNSSVSSISGLSYAMTEGNLLSHNNVTTSHHNTTNINEDDDTTSLDRKRFRSTIDQSSSMQFEGSLLWNSQHNNNMEEDHLIISENFNPYNCHVINTENDYGFIEYYNNNHEGIYTKSECTDMTAYEERKEEECRIEEIPKNNHTPPESDNDDEKNDIVEDKILVKVRFPFYSFELLQSDIDRITGNRAMNDSIIDFFLNHLVFHLLDEQPSRIHVFPSIFWRFMKETQDDDDDKSVDSSYKDIIKSSNRAVMVQQMVACLEGVDLFNFDYLLIPIFEYGQWSLAVVCQPYLLTYCSPDPSKSNDSAAVVFFDSGVSNVIKHFNNAAVITDFIKAQHRITIGRTRQDKVSNDYTSDLSPFDKPKGLNYSVILPSGLPQEEEPTNSGVYLLEYAERFLVNTPNTQEILNKGFDFAQQYPDFSVEHKRREIMGVVRQFSAP
uniref:ULP_PROTEASE domain-containing protein n=1 Tax=Parastrongyloides trichosuri TaxID=131310 RepID=A0A0N4ZFT4_PARTI